MHIGGGAQKSSYAIARDEMSLTKGADFDPFDAHRSDTRVSDRDNSYTQRRLERGFSPVRNGRL